MRVPPFPVNKNKVFIQDCQMHSLQVGKEMSPIPGRQLPTPPGCDRLQSCRQPHPFIRKTSPEKPGDAKKTLSPAAR